jgi:hypothetical protein
VAGYRTAEIMTVTAARSAAFWRFLFASDTPALQSLPPENLFQGIAL